MAVVVVVVVVTEFFVCVRMPGRIGEKQVAPSLTAGPFFLFFRAHTVPNGKTLFQ